VRIFPIYAFKNELVCREVQTHSGRSLPASLTEKVVGARTRFMRPKTKRFAVKFRRIVELSPFKLHKKGSGRIFPIYASKKEAVSWEVQTHSGTSLSASLKEKFAGAIPRLVLPKAKLFPLRFRRILEVLCPHVLKKNTFQAVDYT